MKYLLALIGITLLCAAWVKFQLWLKRIDPQRDDYHPGCGACQGGSCAHGAPAGDTGETRVDLPRVGPGKKTLEKKDNAA